MNPVDLTNLRQRYAAVFDEEPISTGAIASLETSLRVVLPEDVKSIAQFYGGGLVGGISLHAFDANGPATNIVEETSRLRSAIDLPHRYVVLAEPAESLIVLDVDSGIVTWCDNFDVARLDGSSEMLGKPEIWPTYAAFFEFLLDEEDDERAERQQG